MQPQKPIQPLSPSAMQFSKNTNHDKQQVILPDGVSLEAVFSPHFWSFVAKRFAPFDEVQVIPEDGSWIAELYVVQCGDFGAKMVLNSKTVLESIAMEDLEIPEGYSLKWSGPRIGYAILHEGNRLYPSTKDKAPASKLDAMGWLKNYTRNLAA